MGDDWDTASKSYNYKLELSVSLDYMTLSKGFAETVNREEIESHIKALTEQWIRNPKNQQNLMNMILGNTGILI